MIIESSAIVATLRAEEDAAVYAHAIAQADIRRVSVVSFVETSIVTGAIRDPAIDRDFDEFLAAASITIKPVTARQARLAYRDFGRGSGHPARLNFGDCFAYALAREFSEPLLFKGDDFARTDVATALP